MGKAPAYQWYPGDWTKDPAVRALSPEAKAFWREAIDVLFESSARGKFTTTMEGWATATGSPPLWIEMFLSENDCLKVADVTICNSHVTLMSRRMMREEKAREQGRKRVAKHRSKADVTEESEIVTPPSSSSSSSSKKEESDVGPSDIPLFAAGAEPYDLAQYLRDCILANDEKSKVPALSSATFQKWCLSIDRLIRLDKREPEVVAAIIHWCQDDSFWAANIQSADKLRKQFSRLYLQAKEAGASLRFVKE